MRAQVCAEYAPVLRGDYGGVLHTHERSPACASYKRATSEYAAARPQGGSIIQQLRAETGACIKIREEVVSMTGASPDAPSRVDLRIIAISQPASRCYVLTADQITACVVNQPDLGCSM